MNKLYRLLISFAILSASFTLAALPPQHQRAAEFREIIGSIEIMDLFMAQRVLIDGVHLLETDLYVVTGGDCQLLVRIADQQVDKPEGWVGARQFELLIGEISCA